MSLTTDFHFKHPVFIKGGPYSQKFIWEARASHIREPYCALLIYWPKEDQWIRPTIHARIDPETDKNFGSQLQPINREGTSKINDWQLLREKHKVQRDIAEILQTNNFIVLEWYPRFLLEFEVNLESGRESFEKWVGKKRASNPKGADPLNFSFNVLAFSPSVPSGEVGQVDVVMKPCIQLAPFDGGVALDLGNTSSSLVALRNGQWRMQNVMELNGNEGVERDKRLLEQNQPVESVLRIDEIVTMPMAPKPGEAAVPSGITVGSRPFGRPPFTKQDETNPNGCSYVIGKTARFLIKKETPLLFGAKRILQTKNGKGFSMRVRHKDWMNNVINTCKMDFENHHPAELLIARLFQKFSGSIIPPCNLIGFPDNLAVTYPVAYDRHEIEHLRKTVTRAWLRFRGLPQTLEPDQIPDKYQKTLIRNVSWEDIHEDRHPLIPLMIDEATAAAFYFIYKEVFEFAGGLASFSYIYPKGLTILLYDCGGGTTDIALVNAFVAPNEEDRLLLKVLGRTGDGRFGGDNITEAICRLLKAKIIEKILVSRGEPRVRRWEVDESAPDLKGDEEGYYQKKAKDIEEYIAEMGRRNAGDEFVHTQFDRDATIVDYEAKERMIEFWEWAEGIKIALSGPKKALGEEESGSKEVGLKYNERTGEIISLKIGLLQHFRRAKSSLANSIKSAFRGKTPDDILKDLENILITRVEVDAMIRAALKGTIVRANNLLRTKMETASPSDSEAVRELDCVVFSGNGGQYPFIEDLITRELHGVDIQNKKKPIPKEDLKDAVAKGAVLFLNCMTQRGRASVDFDTRLSDCLPFDIGWHDNRTNQTHFLFKEGTRYSKLKEIEVPVFQGGDNTQFSIMRRYPGEEGMGQGNDGFNTYMTFAFEESIRGNLFLKYDLENNYFTLRDRSGQEPKKWNFFREGEEYLAPLETGKI